MFYQMWCIWFVCLRGNARFIFALEKPFKSKRKSAANWTRSKIRPPQTLSTKMIILLSYASVDRADISWKTYRLCSIMVQAQQTNTKKSCVQCLHAYNTFHFNPSLLSIYENKQSAFCVSEFFHLQFAISLLCRMELTSGASSKMECSEYSTDRVIFCMQTTQIAET